MASSSTERASTRSRRVLSLREGVLSCLMIVGAWLLLTGNLYWLPAWVNLGTISFGTVSVIQGLFAVVLILSVIAQRHHRTRMSVGDGAVVGFAALTILAAIYATIRLNTAPGGVFWAGFLPLGTGVLLALVALFNQFVYALSSSW